MAHTTCPTQVSRGPVSRDWGPGLIQFNMLFHSHHKTEMGTKRIARGLWKCRHGSDTRHFCSHFIGVSLSHILIIQPTHVPGSEQNQKYFVGSENDYHKEELYCNAKWPTSISKNTWRLEQDPVKVDKYVSILSSIRGYLLIPDYVKTCSDKRNKIT